MNMVWLEAILLGLPVGLALGLVGGGGSILTVPILIGLLGLEPKQATTASLVIVAANALIALPGYGRVGLVQYVPALTVVVAGLAGSMLGALGNRLVDAQTLTLAFAGLMVVIAARMLYGAGSSRSHESSESLPLERPSWLKLVLVGTLIGLTTGFFGVGGGFVIVPGLVWLGLPMRQAVPTSLLVIVLNSLIGLGLRVAGGASVPLEFALPMIVGGAVGSSLAVRVAPRLGNLGLTRAFAMLVFGLALYMGLNALRT